MGPILAQSCIESLASIERRAEFCAALQGDLGATASLEGGSSFRRPESRAPSEPPGVPPGTLESPGGFPSPGRSRNDEDHHDDDDDGDDGDDDDVSGRDSLGCAFS